ncbi:hypothetical protein HYR99_23705 [Candidatus Poribacteria bacterium]|nr:hypothetical protein [Candidatus Poribacteria bacterium]
MRRDYDSAYKAFYERLFQRWQVPVETQVEVGRRAKTIDVVIKCETEEHRLRLTGTAFAFVRRINSLELKSPEDALDVSNYMLILSRAYGLLAKQPTEAEQLPTQATLTILTSVRPTKILDDLQPELGFFPTSEPGVYLCNNQPIETRIIVATELEVIEKNFPLLILAKGQKLKEFLEEIIRRGLIEYLDVLFQVGVDPDTLMEGVINMAKRRTRYQINMEHFLTAWLEAFPDSADRVAALRQLLKEEERDASLRPASMEALRLLLESKLRHPLEAVALELGAVVASWVEAFPESARRIGPVRELLEEGERNASIQSKLEALSLLLESKFGQLPEALVSKLEALRDVDELDRLYRLALRAQTLDELGL